LSDYLQVMKAFTFRDPDGNRHNDTYGWAGFVDDSGALNGFDPIFGAFNALTPWTISGGKLVATAVTPARLAALKFIRSMIQAGVVDPNSFSQGQDAFDAEWTGGKIGMFSYDWCATFCPQGYTSFAGANKTGSLGITYPPLGPNGLSSAGTYQGNGFMYAMSQQAAQAGKGEAIARLLEWINGPGYLLTAFGQEGTNWTRDKAGNIAMVKATATEVDRDHTASQLAIWAYKGSVAEFGTRYGTTTSYPNGQTVAVYPVLQRAQQWPKTDISSFAALPPPPPDKVADLTRTMASGELQFVLGQRPFSDWPNYVSTLASEGLNEWTAQATTMAQHLGLLK
jgi:putative aldouronate transport system substrate-binding protein